MATRKTASKVTKKAEVNIEFNQPKKSQRNKTKKAIKKLSPLALCLAVLFLAGGAVGGWFGFKFLTKNDCFEIIGKDELTIAIDIENPYVDKGVKIIEFGKDISKEVVVKTNLKKNEDGTYVADEVGTYYIAYTVNSIKYGKLFKVQKIRLITFVEPMDENITPASINMEVEHE